MNNKQDNIAVSFERPAVFNSCGFFSSEAKWKHAHRSLDSYELIIILEKQLHIQVKEMRFCLSRADLLLIPPGYEHEGYFQEEEETRFFWMHFSLSPEQLASNADQEAVRLPYHLEGSNLPRLLTFAHQISHINEAGHYVRQSADYVLTAMLNEIATQYIMNRREKEYYGSAQKIKEWIRINHASAITVPDIAEQFEYSPNYMSHYFSKHVGMSILKYLNTVRVQKACELLLDTRNSIKEVAHEVGFSDSKYFLRIFKLLMHQTPSEYRNAFNQVHFNKK